MCGLVGILSQEGGEENQDFIMNQFQEQVSRGEKGFGLIEAGKDKIKVKRAVSGYKAMVDVARANSPILLFHHRQPTSTDNTIQQTHPILVSHEELAYDYLIMHNGIIRNSTALYKKHTEELGYVYTTKTLEVTQYGSYYQTEKFNDTEAMAIELARYLDKLIPEVTIEGSMAFMGVRVNKKTRKAHSVFWGHNGSNPLRVKIEGKTIKMASELTEGENAEENIINEITMTNFFKKDKKKLEDKITTEKLKFFEEKKDKITVTKDYDPKDVPAYSTDLEWAFTKMGYRAMKNIDQIIMDFYENLPLILDSQDSFDETFTEEDEIDMLMNDMQERITEVLVESIPKGRKVINIFNRKKEQKENEAKKTTIPKGKWLQHISN